jgi:two-component system OmpR family response regulator
MASPAGWLQGLPVCGFGTQPRGLQNRQPDLVILDSQLPDGDGIEFCRWLYSQGQPLVMILSACTAETDIVNWATAGADDYVTKPFGIQEFLARVDALTRRIA